MSVDSVQSPFTHDTGEPWEWIRTPEKWGAIWGRDLGAEAIFDPGEGFVEAGALEVMLEVGVAGERKGGVEAFDFAGRGAEAFQVTGRVAVAVGVVGDGQEALAEGVGEGGKQGRLGGIGHDVHGVEWEPKLAGLATVIRQNPRFHAKIGCLLDKKSEETH
jgi:hypothetical protein